MELIDVTGEVRRPLMGVEGWRVALSRSVWKLCITVPEEVKEERYARFMECAATISTARLARRVGQRLQVLVDRVADGVAYARTAGDAPDIDGVVRIKASAATRPGEFVEATIVAAGIYDLEGRVELTPP